MSNSKPTVTESKKIQGTLKTYVTGFVASIVLTLVPYILIMNHILENSLALTVILLCAIMQLLVQLFFFLHMGRETKPRWKMYVFISFVGIILIIIIGSIWIMQHLNYNMGPIQINNIMQHGEGF